MNYQVIERYKKQLKTFTAKVNIHTRGDKKKSAELISEYKNFLLKDLFK